MQIIYTHIPMFNCLIFTVGECIIITTQAYNLRKKLFTGLPGNSLTILITLLFTLLLHVITGLCYVNAFNSFPLSQVYQEDLHHPQLFPDGQFGGFIFYSLILFPGCLLGITTYNMCDHTSKSTSKTTVISWILLGGLISLTRVKVY